MQIFRQFDFFPKLQQDQAVRQTIYGGSLFCFTLLIIIFLILREFYSTFVAGELIIEQLIDSSNLDERVRVNINITFHYCPCSALALDLQDITGAHLEDVSHTLYKLRIQNNGDYLSPSKAEKVSQFERYINYPSNPMIRWYKDLKRKINQVDDCYGAQLYENQRCITCQDVLLAYSARGWPSPPREEIAQCSYQTIKYSPDSGEMERVHRSIDRSQSGTQMILNEDGYTQITITFAQGKKRILEEQEIQVIKMNEIQNITYLTHSNSSESNILRIENQGEYLIDFSHHQRIKIPIKGQMINKQIIKIQLEQFHFLWDISKILNFTFGSDNYIIKFKKIESIRKLFAEDYGQEQQNPQFLNIFDIAKIQQQQEEGCQLFGHFFIKKVPGNFHIGFHGKGQGAMLLNKEYSVSHTIHLLEFTPEEGEVSLGKYLNTTNTLGSTMHKAEIGQDTSYYIKLVRNKFTPLWSNEHIFYSYTSHEISNTKEEILPQVMFRYEFDAITMHYHSLQKTIFRFLVNLLAIVGGVFSVSLLIGKIFDICGL